MRRVVCVLLGFVLGTGLSSVKAQEEQHPPHMDIDAINAIPVAELTLGEVIDILSDFNLYHESTPLMNHINYIGLTDFKNRAIYINDRYDQATKKETLAHELKHILYWKRGYASVGPIWEQRIAKEASDLYFALYVPKP